MFFRCALALFLSLLAMPASAELRVRVTRPVTGVWESVGIIVTDPRRGLDVEPGPIQVTMADGADRRQSLYLAQTDRPGEWSGRFTPLHPGRYTGTAVLQRGEEKDIGLVPLIRVKASNRRGFVRLSPGSSRALRYSGGDTLFPIGVRFRPEAVRPGVNWKAEFARLRSHDVNYVELPVPWPADLSALEQETLLKSLDVAVIEAELTGRMALQLSFQPPADLSADGLSAYETQLQTWVRRWSYSPAVALWHIAGATRDVSPDARARLVRAVRSVDPYRHLIGVPGAVGEGRAGADLVVVPWNWQRPGVQFAILEVPETTEGPAPLPGESSWQMLVLGGVGLPLWPYQPDAADSGAVLQRIGRLARVAGSIPYRHTASPVVNQVPVDQPGSFCRYGSTWVGWMVPDAERVLAVRSLPRGRYRVRFWDPNRDALIGEKLTWSDGSSSRLELPAGLQAVYVQVAPLSGGEPQARATPQPRRSRNWTRRSYVRRVAPVRVAPAPRPAPVVRRSRPAPVKKVVAKRPAPQPKPGARARVKPVKKPPVKKTAKKPAKKIGKKPAKPTKKPAKKSAKKPVKKPAVKKPAKKAAKKPARKALAKRRGR